MKPYIVFHEVEIILLKILIKIKIKFKIRMDLAYLVQIIHIE